MVFKGFRRKTPSSGELESGDLNWCDTLQHMYYGKQKLGPVFVTRADALLRYVQFRKKRNKSKGGGVVFYVNDELGCEEIKNSVDKAMFGDGVT